MKHCLSQQQCKDAMRSYWEISPCLCAFLWFYFWLDTVFTAAFPTFHAGKACSLASRLAQTVFVFLQFEVSQLLEEIFPDVFFGISEKDISAVLPV